MGAVAGTPDKKSIVWVQVGPRGEYKKRPAVVLSSAAEIKSTGKVDLVVGSTDSHDANKEIVLPCGPNGTAHPLTRLKKLTYITCDWNETVDKDAILEVGGEVPPTLMLEILNKKRHLENTKSLRSALAVHARTKKKTKPST